MAAPELASCWPERTRRWSHALLASPSVVSRSSRTSTRVLEHYAAKDAGSSRRRMMPATRIVRRPLEAPPDGLPAGLHPVLRRVYARAASRPVDLDHSLACLPSPERLAGAAEAAARIARAISRRRALLISATSTPTRDEQRAGRPSPARDGARSELPGAQPLPFGYADAPKIVARPAGVRPT